MKELAGSGAPGTTTEPTTQPVKQDERSVRKQSKCNGGDELRGMCGAECSINDKRDDDITFVMSSRGGERG